MKVCIQFPSSYFEAENPFRLVLSMSDFIYIFSNQIFIFMLYYSYPFWKGSFLSISDFFSIFLIYWFFTSRLKRVLFNPSSRMAREVACQMVESFCSKDFQRKKQIIEMLTTFLGDMSHAGEAAQEFVHLYQRLITPDQVRLLNLKFP